MTTETTENAPAPEAPAKKPRAKKTPPPSMPQPPAEAAREAAQVAPATEPAPKAKKTAAEPAASPAPKKRARKATKKGGLTLGELAGRYLTAIEEAGKSAGTVMSYGIELATATAALGHDRQVADLTAKEVATYFASDVVTKTRTGVQKAKPTVDKTRRVLRLALVWAQEQGYIPKAPIPAS